MKRFIPPAILISFLVTAPALGADASADAADILRGAAEDMRTMYRALDEQTLYLFAGMSAGSEFEEMEILERLAGSERGREAVAAACREALAGDDPYREGWGTIYYNKSLNWAWNQVDGDESRPDRRVAAGDNAAAIPFSMAQNFPNPATSYTLFGFSLPSENAAAVLTIYDLSGRKIRAFEMGGKSGPGELTWDLTDTAGTPVPAGVYVYRLTAGEEEAAKKLIVTR